VQEVNAKSGREFRRWPIAWPGRPSRAGHPGPRPPGRDPGPRRSARGRLGGRDGIGGSVGAPPVTILAFARTTRLW